MGQEPSPQPSVKERGANALPAPPAHAKGLSGLAAIIAAGVTIAAPLSTSFEGTVLQPYWDPAHIRTYCTGETEHVVERKYTPQECADLLRQRQTNDYAPAVIRCVPGLADDKRRPVLAASIDFAYNAGTASFCRSSMARAFNASNIKQGCYSFMAYDKAHVNGKLVVLRGLERRRKAERDLCLKGI